jgi:hypothetical protein
MQTRIPTTPTHSMHIMLYSSQFTSLIVDTAARRISRESLFTQNSRFPRKAWRRSWQRILCSSTGRIFWVGGLVAMAIALQWKRDLQHTWYDKWNVSHDARFLQQGNNNMNMRHNQCTIYRMQYITATRWLWDTCKQLSQWGLGCPRGSGSVAKKPPLCTRDFCSHDQYQIIS